MSGETKHRISCLEIENAELHRQLADRPWSTVPEDTWALVSFYWKKEKVWYEEGQEWDIGIGRTDDRTSRYVNVLHLDLEDHDAVWQPLPKPYRGGIK